MHGQTNIKRNSEFVGQHWKKECKVYSEPGFDMASTNNYTFQLTRSLQSLDVTARKANFIRSQSGISNLQMILLLS